MSNKPIIIRPKDIRNVFQCSPATATRKMSLLKSAFTKKSHQNVTVKEFCQYFDLPEETVIRAIS